MTADEYNRARLAAGDLDASHVTELVRYWQRGHGLDVDGKAGTGQTIPSIEAAIAERVGPPALPMPRCFPLRCLADGRSPRVTSGFKSRNPERPTHNGVDLFYAYRPGDPPMKDGDGGRAGKWWIPDNTVAIAGARGRVARASSSRTGYLVWLDIGGGWALGYMHLSRLLCAVGDTLEMGAPIGIVGDNPIDHDARHLHWELYFGALDGYPTGCRDPEAFLTGAATLPAV